jgi:hypothetical protein
MCEFKMKDQVIEDPISAEYMGVSDRRDQMPSHLSIKI